MSALVSAEDVLPGHPDRLCDALAEAIVEASLARDPQALVAVETALHRHVLLVTGGVGVGTPDDWSGVRGTDSRRSGSRRSGSRQRGSHRRGSRRSGSHRPGSRGSGTPDRFLDGAHLASLVERVFTDAGYSGRWHHSVRVLADLELGPLGNDERARRGYSDDQTIAVGHADPHGPAAMPVEAYAARRARQALERLRATVPDVLGPDGKVLVTVDLAGDPDPPGTQGVRGHSGAARTAVGGPPGRSRLTHINVAAQHTPGVGYVDLYRLVAPALDEAMAELAPWLDAPPLTATTLRINGLGDFSVGGPTVDNGLSGKKLVVDHYGPRVPIGGGALCGKDPHKADRAGPLRARQVAVRLAEHLGQAATVTLGWLPGLAEPDRLAAVLADGTQLDADQLVGILPLPDLSITGSVSELELSAVPWSTAIRRGYVGAGWAWDV